VSPIRNRALQQAFVLLLIALLASPLTSPLSAATKAVGRVLAAAPAQVNGIEALPDATLMNGDRVTTGEGGWVRVLLLRGQQIHLEAQSEALTRQSGETLRVELVRGRIILKTSDENGVQVTASGALVAAKDTGPAVWEVSRLNDTLLQVAAHSGTVEILADDQVVEVEPGQMVRVEIDTAPRAQTDDEGDDRRRRRRRGGFVLLLAGVVTGAIVLPWLFTSGSGPAVSPSGL